MTRARRMYFNPLASERRDYLQTIRRSDVDGISIHSPLRGETYTRGQVGDETSISIHSPLRGETMTDEAVQMMMEFQSTRL